MLLTAYLKTIHFMLNGLGKENQLVVNAIYDNEHDILSYLRLAVVCISVVRAIIMNSP